MNPRIHPLTGKIHLPDSPRLATSLHPFTFTRDDRVTNNLPHFRTRWLDHGNPTSCDPPGRSRAQHRSRWFKRLAVSGLSVSAFAVLFWGFSTHPFATHAVLLVLGPLVASGLVIREAVRSDPGLDNLEKQNNPPSCDLDGRTLPRQRSGRVKRKAVND